MKISSAAFDAEYSIGAPTLFDDATEEVKIWDDLYHDWNHHFWIKTLLLLKLSFYWQNS